MRAPSPYRLPKWRLWPCLELDVCNRVHGHCVRNRYESSDPGFLGPSTMVCPVYQRRLLGQGAAMEHARRRRTHMAGLVVNTAATSPAVSSLHHVRSVWRVVQTPSAAESPPLVLLTSLATLLSFKAWGHSATAVPLPRATRRIGDSLCSGGGKECTVSDHEKKRPMLH